MRPSDALRELLDEHEVLRVIMKACEQAADEVDAHPDNLDRLVREVKRLRIAFEAHNHREESLLPAILRELDAFGDVRISYMVEDHVDEHRKLRARLDAPTDEVRATLEALRHHLESEEHMFLSARVLRDDVVAVESSS